MDGKRLPFRRGPSNQRGFGGAHNCFSKSINSPQQPGPLQNFRQEGHERGFRGKKKYKNRASPQPANRYASHYCSKGTKKCSPNNKRDLSSSNNKRGTPCRKTAIFCKQFANSHKNPDILELISGLRLSFIEEPNQNKPHIKPK